MAKDKGKKKKKEQGPSTDDALKRIFGKDAAKRLRAVASELATGKGKKKRKKKR